MANGFRNQERVLMFRRYLFALLAFLLAGSVSHAEQPKPLKILFLGDNGHHRPADRFRQLQPVFAARGIDLTYTDKIEALNPKLLAGYDGLMVYANIDNIPAEQEKALLDYVENGKGFIPLHCASYCFRNAPRVVDLMGGQFMRHGTGTFRTINVKPDHPIMKGFGGFESWDETYVHTKHNDQGRTILEVREEAGNKEPWTWVRTQGKGRVFYTAWGHDERTWSNPGFHNLVERGTRWAVNADVGVVPAFADRPPMTEIARDLKPFEYVDVGKNIPDYKQGQGKTLTQMQKPLEPVDSQKHMVNPSNFELKLFASEEQMGGKPIAMNWDERGRLWVILTVDYPNNLQARGQGNDRIIILEDTNGDGKADKTTVFADHLSIPTSLVFANKGVIVTQAPHTLFLRDHDGDDKADEMKILFSGWGTGDTHAGPSNLRYGMDNYIYGMVGYSGFDGTVGQEKHRFGQGFYRFKADGSKLEFLRSTSNNSWGVGFSEEGHLFGSTANGNPSVHMAIPNRYYESVRGWSANVLGTISDSNRFYPVTDKIRQVDYHGGFTAAAGHALYTARTYPQQYWNQTAFVTEPTGHLVATFTLQPAGSTFRSHNSWNLLASDDEWCAPVMAEVGPDGNVWVIDWYNYIVQHNPTPPGFETGKGNAYVTSLRDKKHGRIYRLVEKSSKPAAPLSLQGANADTLVDTLKNDNMLWRNHAQRLLIERNQKDVVPALIQLTKDRSVDAIGLNTSVIHALWTIRGLGLLDGSNAEANAAAIAALKHPSAGVRRNVLQVLPRNEESLAAIADSGLARDPNPQVRLTTLLALADMPPVKVAVDTLIPSLEDGTILQDPLQVDALTTAAANHAGSFLAGLSRRWSKPIPPPLEGVIERVANHLARSKDSDAIVSLINLLPDGNPEVASSIITGLSRGWPRDVVVKLNETSEKAMGKLLPKLSGAARGQLISLASRWGTKALDQYAAEIVTALVAQLQSGKESDENKIKAASQLIDFRVADMEAAKQLMGLLNPRSSLGLSQGVLDALAKSEAPGVGQSLISHLPTMTPGVKGITLRVLLGRTDWTQNLLDLAQAGKFPLSELSLDQRQALATHPNRAIAKQTRDILEKGGGLPTPDRQKVIDELLSLTQKSGDPVAGKLVYKTHCAKCHIHSGEGQKIGPELTGMAVHPKAHLLAEIMDPSRNVEGNYRQYVVSTKAGRTLSGLLSSETKTSIDLIDAEAKKHSIQRDDIEELQVSPKSLMPEGFEKQIKPEELVNLLEFLTQRGKYLPLPLDKAATIVTTKGMFYSEANLGETLVFGDWKAKSFLGIPFNLIEPQGDRVPNAIFLYGPEGKVPPRMPRSVRVPCNAPVKTIHLLSGVSGWGFPYNAKGSLTMIVRIHYADGKSEDHPLKNGEHFADYIHRIDVPESKFAFELEGGKQIRYVAVQPERKEMIKEIEFVKGTDRTAPVIMAVTVEGPQ